MRLAEVQRQFRYWAKYPTTRDMVAGYLGFKPPDDHSVSPKTEAEFKRFFLMHGVARG